MFCIIEAPILNLRQYLFSRLTIKWNLIINQFIQNNTQCPDIYFLIIFLAVQQLWRHIIKTSTVSFPSAESSSQTKVNQLGIHMTIQKNCFAFQVSMNDFFLMNILYGQTYPSKDSWYLLFFNLLASHLCEQVTTWNELKNYQYILFKLIMLQYFYYIRVIQTAQALNIINTLRFRGQFQHCKLFCKFIIQKLASPQLPIRYNHRLFLSVLHKLVFFHVRSQYIYNHRTLINQLNLQNANYGLLQKKQNYMIRKIGIFSGMLVLGAASYDYFSQSYVFIRNLRTIRCGLNILYSYKIAFNETNYLQIHDRIAKDIYETCIKNDGLYVKFGQGIATMDHLLPPPFYKHMSKLQDKAKSVSYEKISKVFQQQVGKPIQQCFTQFQKQPIASASIAQVHRATLKNGQKVAVKIQKPNIKKQFGPDMIMHYFINFVIQISFDLPILQFVDDIQKNLKKQLDFRIQAKNAKHAEKNFKLLKRSQLHVPNIIDEFTRQRVMVSQWIDGIKITDDNQLKKYGYNKKQIMNKLIRAFSDQIFVSGFVHCDPHPGNVFVRPHPNNKKNFQIVILDHGLCIELTNTFRKQYSQFWKSMFLQDKQKMKQVCKKWGIQMVDEFAGGQIMRPYNSSKMINQKVQKQDVLKLQAQMKQKMQQMMKQSHNFPKQLLFVGRNMNLVRSLNKYHGSVADRIGIMARSAYLGAQTQDCNDPKTGFSYGWKNLVFSFNLMVLEVTNWVMKKWSGRTIQQYVQSQSIKQSQKMFTKYGFKALDQNAYNG